VERADRLRALYAAFNARDMDVLLASMTDDVDWPNAWEGGRLAGREAVRGYWTRQWAAIDPRVEPLEVTPMSDGRMAVEVLQTMRGLDGALIAEGRVRHVYAFSGELIARMDVEDPAAA
jgi:hypothetical protein